MKLFSFGSSKKKEETRKAALGVEREVNTLKNERETKASKKVKEKESKASKKKAASKLDEKGNRAEICLSLSCETMEDIRQDLISYLDYCTYVEWCVNDTLGSEQWSKEEFVEKLNDVRKWTRGKKLIIVYKEDEKTANRIVRWSLGKTDYVDISAMNSELIDLLKEVKKQKTKVILSYHNYDGMMNKHEIAEQYLRMEQLGGDILKIACMANEEADTYEVLEGAAMYTTIKHHKPIIAIAMGDEGQVSRICAGDFGSVISYAKGTKETAPGQFKCDQLKKFMDRYYEEL